SNFLWMNYDDSDFYISDNLMVKPRYRRLIKGENAADFTPLEFTIFMVLYQHKDEPIAQETLYEAVWDDNNISDSSSTLKMHISNLRRKLKNLLGDKFSLCFVPQKGYRLSFK
ncbi:MAG: winged helix-turn-helix transcriptional regulator, partial [Selenomonadaceae bacterium]|nr:winged helix-turn-helix transcriptional regulator [Selenomonadaceae bacterium]